MLQMFRPRQGEASAAVRRISDNVPPPDPLQSPLWTTMVERFMPDHPIVFDPAVNVMLPPVTQDQTQVPIEIDARGLGQVEQMVVIADLNPFPLTMRMRPSHGKAFVALRQRIEQGTAIRGGALKDGVWHVGTRYLDAAGGGCSAPPITESKVDWSQVGKIRARIWREADDTLRLRLRIVHPMDTGLHEQPAFFIETLKLSDADKGLLSDCDIKEATAMNPTFTFLLDDPKKGDHIKVFARDNNGDEYEAKVPFPSRAASNGTIREGSL